LLNFFLDPLTLAPILMMAAFATRWWHIVIASLPVAAAYLGLTLALRVAEFGGHDVTHDGLRLLLALVTAWIAFAADATTIRLVGIAARKISRANKPPGRPSAAPDGREVAR
jgi:hypothetical protein